MTQNNTDLFKGKTEEAIETLKDKDKLLHFALEGNMMRLSALETKTESLRVGLESKIDGLKTSLDYKLDSIMETMNTANSKIREGNKVLYGNGVEGVLARVYNSEQSIKEIKEGRKWRDRTIISAIVALFLAFISQNLPLFGNDSSKNLNGNVPPAIIQKTDTRVENPRGPDSTSK